jgi:hypothetical protein
MLRFEAELNQSLEEVFRWYRLQLLLLNEEQRRVPSILSKETDPERYRGASRGDLQSRFASDRKHLQHAAMLHLLTTAEALLRLSFRDLRERKTKPAIFREFRRIGRARGAKIRLEEDILSTWAAVYPVTAKSVREFKSALRLRDWLAHGWWWNPKLDRQIYLVEDVFDISTAMLLSIRQAG